MFYDTPASWSSPLPATYSKGVFSSHTLQESPPSAFEWHGHSPSATLQYKRWEDGTDDKSEERRKQPETRADKWSLTKKCECVLNEWLSSNFCLSLMTEKDCTVIPHTVCTVLPKGCFMCLLFIFFPLWKNSIFFFSVSQWL